ncbi:MAG: hypothetical protein ACQKBV_03620 [Puniceicoccales bacterium]
MDSLNDKISLSAVRREMLAQRLRDAWWLNRNGDTFDRPMPLLSVEWTMKREPGAEYQILNIDETDNDDPRWISINPTVSLQSQQSNSRSPMGRPRESRAPFRREANTDENSPTETVKEASAPNPITADFNARLATLETNQRETLSAIKSLSELMQELSRQFGSRDCLQERERFVEEAEERLVEETNRLEAERAELDQLRAELAPAHLRVVGG